MFYYCENSTYTREIIKENMLYEITPVVRILYDIKTGKEFTLIFPRIVTKEKVEILFFKENDSFRCVKIGANIFKSQDICHKFSNMFMSVVGFVEPTSKDILSNIEERRKMDERLERVSEMKKQYYIK